MVFMDIDALARLTGTGPRISGVTSRVDAARLDDLYRGGQGDAGDRRASRCRPCSRQRFQETMQENITDHAHRLLRRCAVIIAFGVVYNSARIQLSERARELATLRVLGFGRGEVSNVLFIEIGAIVAARPADRLAARDRDRLRSSRRASPATSFACRFVDQEPAPSPSPAWSWSARRWSPRSSSAAGSTGSTSSGSSRRGSRADGAQMDQAHRGALVVVAVVGGDRLRADARSRSRSTSRPSTAGRWR